MADAGPSGPSVPPPADEASETITIKVKTLGGETFSLEVPKNITSDELKVRLVDLSSIPIDRQRLIYRGRVVLGDTSLVSAGIEDGHTLHLVERPADAPPPQAAATQEGSGGTQSATATGTGQPMGPGPPPELQQLLSNLFSQVQMGPPGGPQQATQGTGQQQPPGAPGQGPMPPFPAMQSVTIQAGGQVDGMPDMNQVLSQLFSSMGVPMPPGQPPAQQQQQGTPASGNAPASGGQQQPPQQGGQQRQQAPVMTAHVGPIQGTVSRGPTQGAPRGNLPHLLTALNGFLAHLEASANAAPPGSAGGAAGGPQGAEAGRPSPTPGIANLIRAAREVLGSGGASIPPEVQEALSRASSLLSGSSGQQRQPQAEGATATASATGGDPQPASSASAEALLTEPLRETLAALLSRCIAFLRDHGLPRMEAVASGLRSSDADAPQSSNNNNSSSGSSATPAAASAAAAAASPQAPSSSSPEARQLRQLSGNMHSMGLLLMDLGRFCNQLAEFSQGNAAPLATSTPAFIPVRQPQQPGQPPHPQQQPPPQHFRWTMQMAPPRPHPGAPPPPPSQQQQQQHQQQSEELPEGLGDMLNRILPGMVDQAVAAALQQQQPGDRSGQAPPPAAQTAQQPPPSAGASAAAAAGSGASRAAAAPPAAPAAAPVPVPAAAPAAAPAGAPTGLGLGGGLGRGLPGRRGRGPATAAAAPGRSAAAAPSPAAQMPGNNSRPQQQPQPGNPLAALGRGGGGGGGLADMMMSMLQGPQGEGLMAMANQMAQSPAMAQIADQLMGPEGPGGAPQQQGGSRGPPPDLGQMMNAMMPMMESMLGPPPPSGHQSGRGATSSAPTTNVVTDEDSWRSHLSGSELSEWEDVITSDVEVMEQRQEGAEGATEALSPAYLSGSMRDSSSSSTGGLF